MIGVEPKLLEPAERIQFGDWVLDVGRRELQRGDRDVALRPKAFDLLVLLVRRAGRAVSRQEIRRALWPEVSVGEDALSHTVYTLRRALGDDGGRQGVIQTVPRFGFRLALRPTPLDPGEPAPPASRAALPFVGRRAALQLLLDGLEEARKARNGALRVVSGEAGIGKTRLLEEATRWAKDRGFAVLAGRCREEAGAPPYWPWIQVLTTRLEVEGADAMRRALGADAPRVARLSRGLAALDPCREPAPLDPSPADRFRLFEAVVAELGRAGDSAPLLLLLEDVHQADLPSLHLLRFLAREIPFLPVIVWASARDSSFDWDPTAERLLAEMLRLPRVELVPLEGLVPGEIVQLVRGAIGRSPTPRELALLEEKTGGNPFLLKQLIRLLERDRGLRSPARLSAEALPRGAREAVVLQVQRLPAATRRLLEVASVAGREFHLPRIAEAAGIRADEAGETLRPARAAQIVSARAERPLDFRFSHALVSEALYEGIPPAQRAELHGALGEALERACGPEPEPQLAELAHHFLASGDRALAERAISYAERAARWAQERGAFEEAAVHDQRALAALEDYRPEDAATRGRVLVHLAASQALAGDREASRETCRRAAALARRQDSPELLARAALALSPGLLAIESFVFDPLLVALLGEALDALPESAVTLRTLTMARLAVALSWSGREEQRHTLSQRARVEAEQTGEPRAVSHALLAGHAAHWGPDDADERFALEGRILDLCRRTEDREVEFTARIFRISNHLEHGRLAAFEDDVASFARRVELCRFPQARWYTHLFRAVVLLLRGDFAAALEEANRFRAAGEDVQDANAAQAFAGFFAMVQLETRGDAALLPGVEVFKLRYPDSAVWSAALCWFLTQLGARPEAERALDAFGRRFGLGSRDMNWVFTASLILEASAELGDEDRARMLLDRLTPYAERFAVVGFGSMCLGSVARFLGVAHAALSESDQAEHWLARALMLDRRVGGTPWVARSLAARAALRATAGDPAQREAARRDAGEALQLASSLGMAPLAASARRVLESTRP